MLGQRQEEAWHITQLVSSKADGWYEYPKHSPEVQKGLKKNQQLDHVPVCQGPKGEAVTLEEASKSKDSAPGHKNDNSRREDR